MSKLTLAADFRWSEPAQLNGILSKQIVWYWQSDKPTMKSTTRLPQSARHFILDDLKGNVTYFFQVSYDLLWKYVVHGQENYIGIVSE